MAQEQCQQCWEHAELHKGNWIAIGKQEQCPDCAEHAELHARERSWGWW